MSIREYNNKVILYIPLKYGDGRDLSNDVVKELIDQSIKKLMKFGGGATLLDGLGYWEDGDTINKMKTKLIITYGYDLEKGKEIMQDLAKYIKEETKSQSICYEINNTLYII